MKIETIEVKDFSNFKACAFLMPIAGGAPEKEKEKEVEVEEEEETGEEEQETDKDKDKDSEEEESEEDEETEDEEDEETEDEEESEEEEETEDEEDEGEEPKRGDGTEALLQTILNELRAGKKGSEAKNEKEWTLDELDQVETRIENGELPAKYKRFVAEKRAEIIAERTAARTTSRIEFNGKWSESRAEAKRMFPDLKNPKSDLFKTAAALVAKDPAYQKYMAAAQSNPNVNPSDFGLDPDLQLKCAKIAYADLKVKDSAHPKSKTRAKDGLEGGGRSVATLKPSGRAKLDALEAKAAKSGSQNDWRTYFAAREKHLRSAKK